MNMRKKGTILAFVWIALVMSLILVNSSSVKIDSGINKEIEEKGKVDVIIKLKSNNLDGLINIDENSRKYSSFNGISLEINEKQLDKLEKDSRIESIEINKPRKLFLQQSVPLVNADSAWGVNVGNVNITGKDETICVIDTGVNSSHPNLLGKVILEKCYCSTSPPARTSNCCPGNVAESSDAEDWHGHGTHVAGIIAANGSLKGVAPDASIVAVRVFGEDDGVAYDDDIIAGIDFCVSNSAVYNISVISMSLGGGLYTNYCDSEDALFASAINAAVAKNISVIIASGNDGNKTAIASPACIQNATSVGDTYDANVGGLTWTGVCTDATTAADKIVCHANRNSLLDLIAPGALINSSWYNGGYAITGGTSMATPHVAAAFALIKEFYRLSFNKVITPSQIESTLNSTGKLIDDSSGSGYNFSRIDVYSAIQSLDSVGPYVAFISPLNRTYPPYSIIVNITNTSEAASLWWNNGSDNLTYTSSLTLNLSVGSYSFTAYANDSFGNENSSSISFSVDNPSVNITLIYPNESINISYGRFFNISVNASCLNADCGEINISAKINNSGTIELINTTIGATPFYTNESNPRNISLNKDEDEIVIFYVNVTGEIGGNYSFFVDANVTLNISIGSSVEEKNLSIQEFSCNESWSCTAWGSCVSSVQSRTCMDANSCETEDDKPIESQSCDSGDTGGGGGGGGSARVVNTTLINATINNTVSIPENETANKSEEKHEEIIASPDEGNSKKYIHYILGVIIGASAIFIALAFLIRHIKIKWIDNKQKNGRQQKKERKKFDSES